jgi:nicotinate-nucleotide adenylyltransferase
MRHVALYFGSFNPIHNGHIALATSVLHQTDAVEVWMVVSPQSPFKKEQVMMDPIDRWTIARKATMLLPGITVSKFEFDLPKPNYTVATLQKLRSVYPNTKFSIAVGGDIFKNLSKWKDIDEVIQHHKIYVAKRNAQDLSKEGIAWLEENNGRYTIIPMPAIDISSTTIRSLLDTGQDIHDYVPYDVVNNIQSAYWTLWN